APVAGGRSPGRGVVLLQRPDPDVVARAVQGALGGGDRRGGGRQAGHSVHVGRPADVLAVGAGTATPGAADDEPRLALADQVERGGQISRSLVALRGELRDPLGDRYAVSFQVVGGAEGGRDREAELDEAPGGAESGRLVAVGQREEHGAALRQRVTGGRLRLAERQAEGAVDAHHLARR